LSVAY